MRDLREWAYDPVVAGVEEEAIDIVVGGVELEMMKKRIERTGELLEDDWRFGESFIRFKRNCMRKSLCSKGDSVGTAWLCHRSTQKLCMTPPLGYATQL